MQSKGMTNKEINEWWVTDENPLPEAEKEEDKAYKEVRLAAINVAKHLGYGKTRLKEMWDWRVTNGDKFNESLGTENHWDRWQEKRMDISEITSFCKNL